MQVPLMTSFDIQTQQVLWPFFYFDIFNYPLSLDEIVLFSPLKNQTKDKAQAVISTLVAEKTLFEFSGFFSLQNDPALIHNRLNNEQLAIKKLPKARRFSALIASFPFVRAVFISGSLSKKIMTPEADVDYFIITQPGRLWVARTLLILFKKIFLLNSRKYFCLNYFIDSQHLEIEDKNIFSATELITLLPISGQTLYAELWSANRWATQFYPNFPPSQVLPEAKNTGQLKMMAEKLLSGRFGDRLDHYFRKTTINHWRSRFRHLDQDKFEQLFKSSPHISTHHPLDFRTKVLEAWQEKIKDFEKIHQVKFAAIND